MNDLPNDDSPSKSSASFQGGLPRIVASLLFIVAILSTALIVVPMIGDIHDRVVGLSVAIAILFALALLDAVLISIGMFLWVRADRNRDSRNR